MQKRPLKELYQILYDHIKNEQFVCGLCHEITYICLRLKKINMYEYKFLKSHFRSQKPNFQLHPEFFKDSGIWRGGSYWWVDLPTVEASEIRKKFILKMISITN